MLDEFNSAFLDGGRRHCGLVGLPIFSDGADRAFTSNMFDQRVEVDRELQCNSSSLTSGHEIINHPSDVCDQNKS